MVFVTVLQDISDEKKENPSAIKKAHLVTRMVKLEGIDGFRLAMSCLVLSSCTYADDDHDDDNSDAMKVLGERRNQQNIDTPKNGKTTRNVINIKENQPVDAIFEVQS